LSLSIGDLGGAAIVLVVGTPRLAGTMSNTDISSTYTFCARVSSVYIDFLVPTIGLPHPPF
jgi:hypothetical protein